MPMTAALRPTVGSEILGPMASTLGERVRARREELGVSQEELARRVGVSLGIVGRWELDKSVIKADSLGALAKELGVTSDFLLYGGDPPATPEHFDEFLRRYQHLDALTPEDLDAVRHVVGRGEDVASWVDYVQIADWIRTRKVSKRFEEVRAKDRKRRGKG